MTIDINNFNEETWIIDGNYILSTHNNVTPWVEIEEVHISSLRKGTVFSAKDIDGNYIEDETGNNIFKAMSEVKQQIAGPYIDCLPIGKLKD